MGKKYSQTFFQFLSTVHAKVANSNPTNYIFLRSVFNTLSIEHIKSPFFQNFKIRLECLPYAPSNRCNPYRQHETSKRRQYEERVREVEHGNFSPLVFSTSGGMVPPPLWLTNAWPSSYLVSGNHRTVG